MRTPSRHHTLKLLGLPLSVAILIAAAGAADAAVQVTVDKNTQTMEVAIDGVHKWTWPVSTGVPSHETPNGTFRAFRMEADHFSKEWDDAPMPHSIFFTKIGHAIHGTDAVKNLGNPASHGCVRLSKDHAAELYALVEKDGVLNTTVTLTGSSQIALARGRQNINVASAAPTGPAAAQQQPLGIGPRGVQQPGDDLANDPYDYQRQPAPQGYQQNYGAPTYVRPPGYVGRTYQGGYAQQDPVPQPYPQQGYAYSQGGYQGGGYAQPQYGAPAYPNYPGYNRGPASDYYYGN